MSVLAYKRYKVEQKNKSESEDSILLLAYELMRLKDEKGMNLFWNDNEENTIREYIDKTMKFSKN
jgi:hypothetical protein